MIEVNLFSITPEDFNSRVGRCIARNRFDRETIGTSIEDFLKGFLKDNLDKFESRLGIGDLSSIVYSSDALTRKDISCINYYLSKVGLKVQVQNVADDEENPTGIPEGIVEWNVINRNFIQNDYPTTTKVVPSPDSDIIDTLKQIVDDADLFDDKFVGMKNPFTELFDNLKRIKDISGSTNAALVGKIYEYLDQLGFEVFCATSEE